MSGLAVIHGARLECDKCPGLAATLTVVDDPTRSEAEGQPVATVRDFVVGINIQPFPGPCSTTGQPCVPAPAGPWTPGEAGLRMFGKGRLLAENAVLACTTGGGEIAITDPAQTTVELGVADDGHAFHGGFSLVDEHTGEPLRGRRYRITTASGRVIEGVTNANGETVEVGTDEPEDLELEILDEHEHNVLDDDDDDDDDPINTMHPSSRNTMHDDDDDTDDDEDTDDDNGGGDDDDNHLDEPGPRNQTTPPGPRNQTTPPGPRNEMNDDDDPLDEIDDDDDPYAEMNTPDAVNRMKAAETPEE